MFLTRKYEYVVEIYLNGIVVERKFFDYEHRLINSLLILKNGKYERITINDKNGNKWEIDNFLSQVLYNGDDENDGSV